MQELVSWIPPEVIERHKQYCQLAAKSKNGMLAAKDVAEYYKIKYATFCRLVKDGALPFAFSDKKAGRAVCYIDLFTLHQYVSQGQPFLTKEES